MKIEAVTVCINYSDVFAQCIGNKKYLDRWVVVTHETDQDTIKLCQSNNIEVVLSNEIYKNSSQFAKGRAINEGLHKLEKTDWLLHIDSDVKLPRNFKSILRDNVKDINCLYGSCRYHKNGKVNIEVDNENNAYDHIKSELAIGFFQLWHSSKFKDYPQNSDDAKWDDLEHSDRFKKKIFLPLFLLDIDNEHNKNHHGRINN